MNHENSRIASSVVLALAVLVGAAVMTGLTAIAGPAMAGGPGEALGPTASCAGGHGTTTAEYVRAAQADQEENSPEPMACRRAPECSTDADCDVRCGAGLGKCVHSNCPVRVCHCR